MREAEDADRLLAIGKSKGPLHGLPIALKDNIETKGLLTTAGSKILANHVPQKDASIVKKLRRAGGVILGKTNMHELALGATTNNPHYGPALNPYDRTRISGGSSGGSAVAVASGFCAAAIGTDTGGSVRVPAAFCGTVGLKPTNGRVGRGGIIPLSFTRDTVGPITRTVLDSGIILGVIAGKDPGDSGSVAHRIPRWAPFEEGLKGKRLGLPRRFIEEMIDPATKNTLEESINKIREHEGIVVEVEVAHLNLARSADFNVVMAEAVCLLGEYFAEACLESSMETLLDRMGADVRALFQGQIGEAASRPIPGYLYLKTLRDECEKMKWAFRTAMQGLDALFLPTVPSPAPLIDLGPDNKDADVFATNIRNCLPASIVGYPAISVPAGYDGAGLPIGLQFISRPWEEEKLLAIAHAFEQATRVRRPPRL